MYEVFAREQGRTPEKVLEFGRTPEGRLAVVMDMPATTEELEARLSVVGHLNNHHLTHDGAQTYYPDILKAILESENK